MSRIILGLAVTNYLLLGISVYTGLLSDPPTRSTPNLTGGAPVVEPDTVHLGTGAFRYHFPMGIFTAIFSLLAHCMVFTYFVGTTRWVRETSSAYHLDADYYRRSHRLRIRAFAVALSSMLLVVATIASGAGAHTKVWPGWVHDLMPIVAYGFMLWAYRVEYLAIETHTQLTEDVMAAVNEMRRERGLKACV